MFLTLLAVTLVLSTLISLGVVRLFSAAIDRIMMRILNDEVAHEWTRYLRFAIVVVGISSGVRIWQLERYIPGGGPEGEKALVLNTDRWVLEVYRTIIGSLQGIAWMLLVFFIFALVAFVVVKLIEMKRSAS